MNTVKKQITMVVSVAFQDAGEATRSLEMMSTVKKIEPKEYSLRIIFFSHGSKFDQKALENGFELYSVEPAMEGKGFLTDLKSSATNFIGDTNLAAELLQGEIKALQTIKPDVSLYGFWPIAGLARKMVSPVIPGICFLPVPLAPSLYGSYLMRDIPDQIKPLTLLPLSMRRKIMSCVPKSLTLKLPMLKQQNLLDAANQCGWSGEPLANLFDLLKSDVTIVTDWAGFYEDIPIPSDYILTGPIYAKSTFTQPINPEIKAIFEKSHQQQINIFCSMGSSAKKEYLIEAVKAIATLPANRFHAVILVPAAICPMDEITPLIQGHPNIYATKEFVPAAEINAMADMVLCHGGQGTIQTAMACGCPVIGFAMQPEQQVNLDHIVLQRAGIRIPANRWRSKNILKAIHQILSSPTFHSNAVQLGQKMNQTDGKLKTAQVIWDFIKTNLTQSKG